jgi:hypothetical protein
MVRNYQKFTTLMLAIMVIVYMSLWAMTQEIIKSMFIEQDIQQLDLYMML